MAPLHTQTTGVGKEVVLIHGWGLHSGVWERVADDLAADHCVIRIDLPGFGRSQPWDGSDSLDAFAQQVVESVPHGAIWIGWSLGGMVALQAALAGASIARLVLVAATARFVRAPDWPAAVSSEVLDAFARDLDGDFRATVQRFLALQARGSERAQEELRRLRGVLWAVGEPDREAVRIGLDILRHSDLRRQLSRIGCPVLVLQGERDTLVPAPAGAAVAAAVPDGRLEVIAGAGHAPFLSHPETFCRAVRAFIGNG